MQCGLPAASNIEQSLSVLRATAVGHVNVNAVVVIAVYWLLICRRAKSDFVST